MDFVCKVWIWYIHQLCSHSLMGIQINDTINYQRVLDMCPEMEGIGGHKALSCHNTLFIHRILVFLLYIEHTHPSPDNKIPGPTQLLYPDKVWNHRLNDKMLHILVWWFLSSKDSLWLQSWWRWAEVLLPLRGVNMGMLKAQFGGSSSGDGKGILCSLVDTAWILGFFFSQFLLLFSLHGSHLTWAFGYSCW